MNKYFYKFCLMTVCITMVSPLCVSAEQNDKDDPFFIVAPVKLIDTGLDMARMTVSQPVGEWVDENRIVINARLQGDGTQDTRFTSAMLYDLRTGEKREIMHGPEVRYWNTEKKCATFGYSADENGQMKWHGQFRWVYAKLDAAGNIIETQYEISDLSKNRGLSSQPYCDRFHKNIDPSVKTYKPLNFEHGYIDAGTWAGKKNTPVIFYRPDGVNKKLLLDKQELISPRYLPFLNKYQLNRSSCSFVDRKCPTDAVLMSLDGELETIELPTKIIPYVGTVDAGYVVKDGILLVAGDRTKNGFYLFRNNKLYQLWTLPRRSFFNVNSEQFFSGIVLSPDGCKVSFFRANGTNSNDPRRVFVFDHCGIGR